MFMQHITPRVHSTLPQELYVYAAAGLHLRFNVRLCVGEADMPGIRQLVQSLSLGDVLLTDAQQYVNARRDDVRDTISLPSCCNVVFGFVSLRVTKVL